MGDRTSIEWAANADGTPGATWNPLRARDRHTGKTGTFCVHASAGCVNCYAETFQQRSLPGNGIGLAYTAQNLPRVEFYLDEKMLAAPLRKQKPTTWFLSSMTDVFAEFVTDAMLDQLFVVMAQALRHKFIVLTKRSDRMRRYVCGLPARRADLNCHAGLDWVEWPLPNVWLVVSCEDQANADARIPDLLATPAAVHGVSCEPLLGRIDLSAIRRKQAEGFMRPLDGRFTTLDWVIAGGESGPGARPMHPDWARALRDQCAAASVPFFFKQWGEHFPADLVDQNDNTPWRTTPKPGELAFASKQHNAMDRSLAPVVFERIGKRAAGRLLDGVEHNERPDL